MGKSGNALTSLLLGAAVGVAVGYLLATDKETREEDLEKIKKTLEGLKSKASKKAMDVEEEIYHS
ncbi:MAG: YtxH domain-containing protein [Chitinophagia bacterium]|nr:YtxH domain-containing protein [Chitinophagia bacterium]